MNIFQPVVFTRTLLHCMRIVFEIMCLKDSQHRKSVCWLSVTASDQSDSSRVWKVLATRLVQRWSPSVNHVVRMARRVLNKFSSCGNRLVPRLGETIACWEHLFIRMLKPSQLHLDLLLFVLLISSFVRCISIYWRISILTSIAFST